MARDEESIRKCLPAGSKKVFTGAFFDVYQWQQKMFDGSYALYEHLARNDGASILPVTVDKKIILIHETQPDKGPYITFPGGRLESGEDPLDGAKRELLEETGYEANELKLWYTVNPFSRVDFKVYVYIARGCKKVAEQHLDPGEKITLELITLDQFIDLGVAGKFREPEICNIALHAKLDRNKRKELEKLLFG